MLGIGVLKFASFADTQGRFFSESLGTLRFTTQSRQRERCFNEEKSLSVA